MDDKATFKAILTRKETDFHDEVLVERGLKVSVASKRKSDEAALVAPQKLAKITSSMPVNEWDLDKCLLWLRNEVRMSEDQIEQARAWLSHYDEPSKELTLEEARRHIKMSEMSEKSLADQLAARTVTSSTSETSATLSGHDWDVVPVEKWDIDMCMQWLRDEMKWKEQEIEIAGEVLKSQVNPGEVLRCGDISSLSNNGISIDSIASLRAKNARAPHIPGTAFGILTGDLMSLGPYAEALKRWAECVSRPERRIETIEAYNEVKNNYDGVTVLRYSDLVKELEDEDKHAFALMREQKLQLLADAGVVEDSIDASSYDMEVRILPQGLIWPSFFVAKQEDAVNKHMLLRRIQPPVKDLEDRTVTLLSNIKPHISVLWIGAAGIGKSSHGNVVAEQLMKNIMNECGKVRLLAWRIDDCLYFISRTASGDVRVESHPVSSIDDLENESEEIANRSGILIVELKENENLPAIACCLLCSSSIKDISTVFKNQRKMCHVKYFVNPYEFWEAQAAANLMHRVAGGEMNQSRQYAATVMNRFGEIGGLPRYLFCSNVSYNTYMDDLSHASRDPVELWNAINNSNFNDIVKSAKYFLAPLHTHTHTQCLSWRVDVNYVFMQFLSTYCEELIIQGLTKQLVSVFIANLKRFPIWLSMEKLLHASLSANEEITRRNLSIHKAEWFIDPGHNILLLRSCKRAPKGFVSSIPLFTRTAQVLQAISYSPVTDYEDNVLYVAADNVNMVVAECFMVDKREECKRVFLYQTSMSPAKAHAFKETNIRKYVAEMRLRELEYTLHLVYVRGTHLSGDTGLSFINVLGGEKGDLAEDLRDIVKTYVVRGKYNWAKYVMLPKE